MSKNLTSHQILNAKFGENKQNQQVNDDSAKDQQKIEKIDLTGHPEKTGHPTGHPVTQKLATQSPSLDDQEKLGGSKKLATQKVEDETQYPSRTDRHKLGIRIPKHKFKQYQMWCFLNNMKLQDAFELAMDRLVGGQQILGDWVTGHPVDHDLDRSDDLIDDKLSSIMSFYEKWTGNKVKDKDKFVYEDIAHLDVKIIQIGILLSVARSKSKINSFRYCIAAIQETAHNKPSDTDYYTKYLTEAINKKNKNTVK